MPTAVGFSSSQLTTGLLSVFLVLLAVALVAVIVSWADQRHRATLKTPRPVHIPHKSGPVIMFPNQPVRWLCRRRARHHGMLRHYHGLKRGSTASRATPRRGLGVARPTRRHHS
ncbi:MAG: hypothetical protein M0Z36_04915 [Thermaerobacter sp.]|nr:hypothetical protein [Thermaerobacter sp.]